MKFILSRKGFDSSWGGHACPLISDRTLLMIPIPVTDPKYADADTTTYAQLRVPGTDRTFFDVMQSHKMTHLTAGSSKPALTPELRCHLDPDLTREVVERPAHWRAAFGQGDAAEGHLRRQSVGVGDIFLFFGLFRRSDGTQFLDDSPPRHILFGYLQVGEVFRTDDKGYRAPAWSHPHFAAGYTHQNGSTRKNAVYGASDCLTLNGKDLGVPGHGTFTYDDKRVLTKPHAPSHTMWKLPDFFEQEKVQISYHRDGGTYGWKHETSEDKGYFQSAHRGQEFVFDATPSAIEWFTKTLLPA